MLHQLTGAGLDVAPLRFHDTVENGFSYAYAAVVNQAASGSRARSCGAAGLDDGAMRQARERAGCWGCEDTDH
jgi:hypothetical protein